MKKRFFAIFSIFLGLCAVSGAAELQNSFDVFRDQYIEYNTRSLISDVQAANYINNQRSDGTWPDIDYTDKTMGGGWKTVVHMRRVKELSRVYAGGENISDKEALRQTIVNGLEHWFDKDYTNPNWFWNRIGVPREAAEALVLMGDAVPEDIVRKALTNVLSEGRTSIDMRRVGANRISMAGIEIEKGWIRKEEDRMSHAATTIINEIKVLTGEGIQPDYSYHLHHNMLQMRTYGFNTIIMVNKWIHILRGTEWSVPADRIEIIRDYILEGHTWLIWNGMYDYNAMARNLSGQSEVATRIHGIIEDMIKVDPDAKEAYELRLRWPNELIGSKLFWRSDFAVHRQPDWYASIRMKSTRLIGGENTNNDNPYGLHCASGSQMVSITGREYEDIAKLWNWHRLPGTTVDQGITNLTPPSRALMKGNSDFVGGFGDGAAGVAVMVYELDGFNAKKAWFFEENAIIALGVGIDGPTLGNALTSVEQSLRSGPVTSSMGGLASGNTSLPAGSWVHHADIGYKVNDAANVFLPVSPNTFSIWIDHGRSPRDETYSYTIYPLTSAESMSDVIADHTTQVLSNTVDLQATEGAHGLHAIFYTAGRVTMSDGRVVSVSAPCVLSLRGDALLVSDPTHRLNSVDVTIDRDTIRVNLPTTGGRRGSLAKVDLGDGNMPY